MTSSWGILAPEQLASERRTRTLGLGAAVRMFNDLAVPGMGGVWFGKQLFLATLGVAVAEQARLRNVRCDNIKVANAIEALACWMEHDASGGSRDARLRGVQKLGGVTGQPIYAKFSQPGFYVSQPMRMATVQALKALGLVEANGERFNGYTCTDKGLAFVSAVVGQHRPHNGDAISVLGGWVGGAAARIDTAAMRAILAPTRPLPDAAASYLRELLVRGEGSGPVRRRAALDWIDAMANGETLAADSQPPSLGEAHWHDIQAGTLFFAMQGHAYRALDAVEVVLAGRSDQCLELQQALTPMVSTALAALRESARRYLEQDFHDTSDSGANAFARKCASGEAQAVLAHLVQCDERVLRLRENTIVPGPAFDPAREHADLEAADPDTPDTPELGRIFPFPQSASYRLRNLFLLHLDLGGNMDRWLDNSTPFSG